MNINIAETVRKMMGWCPNAEIQVKKEGLYLDSYGVYFADKIKGVGFNGFLGVLHLVYAAWLVFTAIKVLGTVQAFPWYLMELTLISTGILLLLGVSSLMMFFNFLRSVNIQRVLASINVVLVIAFFLYLSQSLIRNEIPISVFEMPYNFYTFGIKSLITFTVILAVPNILALLSRPGEERKRQYIMTASVIFVLVFASLGGYYLYLNAQKDGMLMESGDGYSLYRIDPAMHDAGIIGFYASYPYYLDSGSETTGHPISDSTYEAIQFLRSKESGSVLGWWDYDLEIRAANKEPVIAYASEEIKMTVARPISFYDTYESHEKVLDVSRFFTTDSEAAAKGIAEKYGSKYVYISRSRWDVYFMVMHMAAWPDFRADEVGGYQSREFIEGYYEPSMAYKFNTGAEMEYFEKVFENEDVMIYELK